jgi:hypothetical protein
MTEYCGCCDKFVWPNDDLPEDWEDKLCSSAPMSIQSYDRQDIFLSHVTRLAKEHPEKHK